MPTYEYEHRGPGCSAGRKFEIVQGFHDDPYSKCPLCGRPVTRLISVPLSAMVVGKDPSYEMARAHRAGTFKPELVPLSAHPELVENKRELRRRRDERKKRFVEEQEMIRQGRTPPRLRDWRKQKQRETEEEFSTPLPTESNAPEARWRTVEDLRRHQPDRPIPKKGSDPRAIGAGGARTTAMED